MSWDETKWDETKLNDDVKQDDVREQNEMRWVKVIHAETGIGTGNGTGNKTFIFSTSLFLLPPNPHAFREGGEDGVVEGLAPLERRLPPPESMGVGKEEEHAFVLNSMFEIYRSELGIWTLRSIFDKLTVLILQALSFELWAWIYFEFNDHHLPLWTWNLNSALWLFSSL